MLQCKLIIIQMALKLFILFEMFIVRRVEPFRLACRISSLRIVSKFTTVNLPLAVWNSYLVNMSRKNNFICMQCENDGKQRDVGGCNEWYAISLSTEMMHQRSAIAVRLDAGGRDCCCCCRYTVARHGISQDNYSGRGLPSFALTRYLSLLARALLLLDLINNQFVKRGNIARRSISRGRSITKALCIRRGGLYCGLWT